MIDPSVEGVCPVAERLVDHQHGCVVETSTKCMVVIVHVVANTSRNRNPSGIVYFKRGDSSVGIHKLEGDWNVGDGLTAIVDDAEGDGVFFKIDASAAAW